MKRIVRLTERDLSRIVRRVISEQVEIEPIKVTPKVVDGPEVIVKGKKPTTSSPMKVRIYGDRKRKARIDNWEITDAEVVGNNVEIQYDTAGKPGQDNLANFSCLRKVVKSFKGTFWFSEQVTAEMMKLCDEYADMGSDMGDMA
jgi:hypothetical protein